MAAPLRQLARQPDRETSGVRRNDLHARSTRRCRPPEALLELSRAEAIDAKSIDWERVVDETEAIDNRPTTPSPMHAELGRPRPTVPTIRSFERDLRRSRRQWLAFVFVLAVALSAIATALVFEVRLR